MFQFITRYQHSDGHKRIRVTTTCRYWANFESQKPSIASGFDCEAASVVMGRLASWRASSEFSSKTANGVPRWLDKSLIHLVQHFANYRKDEPDSLELPNNFTFFPQFMFYLRRSQFLRVFNNSPDETVYYRYHLLSLWPINLIKYL